jgi:6-phosphogluconolactonase
MEANMRLTGNQYGHILGATLSLVVLGLNARATTPRFAYVANSKDNTVSIYTVNASSGQLRNNGWALTGSKPVAVRLTPAGKFLYVANSSSANVSAFRVNATNGGLSTVAGSPFAADRGPDALATDPSGKFLYVANKTSGSISAHHR